MSDLPGQVGRFILVTPEHEQTAAKRSHSDLFSQTRESALEEVKSQVPDPPFQ